LYNAAETTHRKEFVCTFKTLFMGYSVVESFSPSKPMIWVDTEGKFHRKSFLCSLLTTDTHIRVSTNQHNTRFLELRYFYTGT